MGDDLCSWRLTNRSWGKGFRIVADSAFFLRLPAYKRRMEGGIFILAIMNHMTALSRPLGHASS
jgi:hypothetical protein